MGKIWQNGCQLQVQVDVSRMGEPPFSVTDRPGLKNWWTSNNRMRKALLRPWRKAHHLITFDPDNTSNTAKSLGIEPLPIGPIGGRRMPQTISLFPEVSLAGWFIMENHQKRMIWGYTHFRKPSFKLLQALGHTHTCLLRDTSRNGCNMVQHGATWCNYKTHTTCCGHEKLITMGPWVDHPRSATAVKAEATENSHCGFCGPRMSEIY